MTLNARGVAQSGPVVVEVAASAVAIEWFVVWGLVNEVRVCSGLDARPASGGRRRWRVGRGGDFPAKLSLQSDSDMAGPF